MDYGRRWWATLSAPGTDTGVWRVTTLVAISDPCRDTVSRWDDALATRVWWI
jgi:hypothetical protein